RPRKHRLPDPRHIFEQDVALAQDGDDNFFNDRPFADDDPLDLIDDPCRDVPDPAWRAYIT
ncbi:MAG: hypothetical protein H0W23_04855, partial [Chloroflexia bacterium]|nr:hypothetical protein [Chloroflexia bacterium]